MKYILSYISGNYLFLLKGIYEVVNNLGSLAARFIFRPIEDSGYFYFTQMVKRDKTLIDQDPVRIAFFNVYRKTKKYGLYRLFFSENVDAQIISELQ